MPSDANVVILLLVRACRADVIAVKASATFHFPPAHGQAPAGNGSDLPPLPKSDWATWQAGSIQMVEFSIYANHGGGYSYRLCKNEGNPMTEECYQQTPLEFATDMSTAHYWDNSHPDVQFEAVTTKVGTYPAGSMWRKNPVPMCNCDIGTGCRSTTAKETEPEQVKAAKVETFERIMAENALAVAGNECHAVLPAMCGDKAGVNTCEKCDQSTGNYDCVKCCPGTTRVTKGGYSWCQAGNPPGSSCDPSDPSTYRQCYSIAYPKSYLAPGQTIAECNDGVQYPTSWQGPGAGGAGIGGQFNWSIQDKIKIPAGLAPGAYSISWRWDCEETPQVWNSCSDVMITA